MRNCLILSFLILNQFSFSQVKVENDSIIIWNKDRKITWNDFLSENKISDHKYRDHAAALIVSIQIYPKEMYCWDIDNLKVVAQMNKNKSWAKFKTDEVLNHEQTHFDLAELYARMIRKEIVKFINENEECDLQGIADIYYRIEDKHWQAQFLYDNEIRECEGQISELCHNLEVQQVWDKKINKLLEEYKDYELIIDIDDLELE